MNRSIRRLLAAVGIAAGVGAPLTGGAVNLTTNGVGEVAIAPYYTVRDGWQTLLHVTNTVDVPVVLKVRVREAINSRDVLDFNVALGAFDTFVGAIREAPDGSGPIFVAADSPNERGEISCTIPGSIALAGNGADEPYVNDVRDPANRNRSGQPLSPFAFSGQDLRGVNDDGGTPADDPEAQVDRLREGFVEFVVLGYTEPGTLEGEVENGVRVSDGVIDIAAAIEANDCNLLDRAFSRAPTEEATRILETARQFGEPINAIKYNYSLINPARGVSAGGTALAWANFYNPVAVPATAGEPLPRHPDGMVRPGDEAGCTVTRGDERGTATQPSDGSVNWRPDGASGSCRNLVTAQDRYAFLEPTLNDAYPAIARWWSDQADTAFALAPATRTSVGGVENYRGIDAMSLTIQRSAIFNEWSNNSALGVESAWIVNMPTKAFYVDSGPEGAPAGQQVAIIPDERDETILRASAPTLQDPGGIIVPYRPFAERFDGESCNQANFELFDRAAQSNQPRQLEEGLSLDLSVLGNFGNQLSAVLDVSVETVSDLLATLLGGAGQPDPQTPQFLCEATNIVTFGGKNDMLKARNPKNVAFDPADFSGNASGWMFMSLNEDDAARASGEVVGGIAAAFNGDPTQPDAVLDADLLMEGLPVIGITMTQRTFGSASRNFARAVQHGYTRCPVFLDSETGEPLAPLPACAAQ
jgi:hypothetical protein